MKNIFKILAIGALIVAILFGIYRRAYLAQAIPVYLQYLEQRKKWEKTSTGTFSYIYHDNLLGSKILFVHDNTPVKITPFRDAYTLDRVFSTEGLLDIASRHPIYSLDYFLIESRFDDIRTSLFKKLWDNTPFQDRQESHMYSIKILYDSVYGYPMIVDKIYNGKNIILGQSITPILSVRLKMLPKQMRYSDELLKKLLQEYQTYDNKIFPDGNVRSERGGNIVSGAIFE